MLVSEIISSFESHRRTVNLETAIKVLVQLNDFNDNYAIRWASKNGHLEIVRSLLSDPRIDPSACYNKAICVASENGHLEIVRLLLSDSRVDPSAQYNWSIRVASENGHLEIVRLLLSDSRVDPSAQYNWSICVASENGHLEIVRLLLSDHRVDPSDDNNEAIFTASANGHIDVVCLLLTDPRVDFNRISNEGMKQQLLKEEKNKLRNEFSFSYQAIQRASPQISIEGKQKSKIPSALIRKIVYEASRQEMNSAKIPHIKKLSLTELL